MNHCNSINKLVKLDKSKNIENIYSGREFTIYSYRDKKTNKISYFAAGHNIDGELGLNITKENINKPTSITFFNHNDDIIIKKVCLNVNSGTAFWIADDGIVYGNGDNYCGQLGLGGH